MLKALHKLCAVIGNWCCGVQNTVTTSAVNSCKFKEVTGIGCCGQHYYYIHALAMFKDDFLRDSVIFQQVHLLRDIIEISSYNYYTLLLLFPTLHS